MAPLLAWEEALGVIPALSESVPLADLIAKRHALDLKQGYRRRRADRRHMRTDWIKRQKGRVYLAAEATTLADQHLKYVSQWSPYFPFTPGELARVYLDDLMRQQLMGWNRITPHFKLTPRDDALLKIQAPLYFDPSQGRRARFVYIDIAACYFELFHRHPLNLAYNPESGAIGRPAPALRIPESDYDWLRAAKPLRHAMFGMMQTSSISWYRNGSQVTKNFLGTYAAPDLVALVKTQLRQIARDAIATFDCRMWMTDAGIFVAKSENVQAWFSERWGLKTTIKAEGMGYLWALGDYRVGRTVTKQGAHVELSGFSNLS